MVYVIEHKQEREPRLDNEQAFLNALAYKRWLEGDKCSVKAVSLYRGGSVHELYGQRTLTLDDLIGKATFYNDVVCPIGSIEFTNKILNLQGFSSLRPVEFPMQMLNSPEYRDFSSIINRSTYYTHNGGKLDLRNFNSLPDKKCIIKSATMLKSDINDIYSTSDKRLENFPKDRYYIAEWLGDNAFVSEYRIIVAGRDKQIQSVRPYIGDVALAVPDLEIVDKFIKEFKDSPPYYSIDVGVTASGKTVLIEIHNYLCLGSYGYDNGAMFIPMTAQALMWEISRNNK